MTAPLRGTQSLVGQMGWVFSRPALVLIEVGWRWVFGIPFLLVCWRQVQQILAAVPPDSAGLTEINAQNPWQASLQLTHAWGLYAPHVAAALHWLAPVAALAWAVVSGLGRNLMLKRLDPVLGAEVRFRPAGDDGVAGGMAAAAAGDLVGMVPLDAVGCGHAHYYGYGARPGGLFVLGYLSDAGVLYRVGAGKLGAFNCTAGDAAGTAVRCFQLSAKASSWASRLRASW